MFAFLKPPLKDMVKIWLKLKQTRVSGLHKKGAESLFFLIISLNLKLELTYSNRKIRRMLIRQVTRGVAFDCPSKAIQSAIVVQEENR